MDDSAFWLSLFIITFLGVSGGVLFKYGTGKLGRISLQRLLDVEFSGRFWLKAGLMVIGLLLFIYGGWSLRGEAFAMKYLFSPVIFGALVLMFMSRFLVGIPLSVTGLGRFTSISLSLMVLSTAVASVIFFGEKLGLRIVTGILMSVVAVALLSGE